MTVKIDRPGEPGEYDEPMRAFLQLVWGDGFLSPGGADEVARLLEGSDIAGAEVLDIGSGLGAVDRLLAETYRAGSVVGIDIEPDLVAEATDRIAAAGLAGRVHFRCVTPGPLPFPDGSFDVVFSKDAVVQIPDKKAVFAEACRVLRPGGRFIASDWLRGGDLPYSAAMLEFFRLEGITYNMASLGESAEALRAVGFREVEVRDRHDWYLGLARQELAQLQGALFPVMVERLGADKTRHFVENWRQLVVVLELGELRPGHMKAVKPAA
ncbi:MAG TPA: methyltransferase domain-containing protein [Stellaceae bacterium]|nr:methyltransferase domain-containing protein [Stellaceae bacterium]